MEPHDDYRERPPAETLRPFVECFWMARRGPAGRVRVLPDGCADLLIDASGSVRFVSTMTSAAVVDVPANQHLFAVRFRPGGAAALLGISIVELADFAGPWSAIDKRRSFDAAVEELCAHGSMSKMQAELSKLVQRVSERSVRSARLAEKVAASTLPVARLADELSISRQHLNRSVRAATGISAKQLGRIGRLRRLTRAVDTLGLGAPAALHAGYCDQSHMVNEFRALSGITPGQYLRERS